MGCKWPHGMHEESCTDIRAECNRLSAQLAEKRAEVARLRGPLGEAWDALNEALVHDEKRYGTWTSGMRRRFSDVLENARAALAPPADGSVVVVLTEEERLFVLDAIVHREANTPSAYHLEQLAPLAAKFAKEGK